MDKSIKFVFLDGHTKEIPLSLKQFLRLPERIMEAIYLNGEYNISSNVQEEIFIDFLNHLLDNDNNLMIDQNNIIQIHLLNIEFGISSDLQSQPGYQEAFNTFLLTNIKSEKNQDKTFYENHISKNLDLFIENYKDDMYDIPIQSLYNIFNDKDRVLENHDSAYNFIIEGASETERDYNNQNLFILLETLDGKKLSEEIMIDCISKRNDHFFYLPQNCFCHNDKINLKQKMPQIITAMKECAKIQDQIKTNKLKTVNFPENLIFIPDSFALNCSKITDVNIPLSVKFISSSAFSSCTSLEHIQIPSSVTIIESSAFSNCSSLTKVEISSSVIKIGNGAFSGCCSLMQIEIPSSVISIGQSCFSDCLLKEIDLPSSVISVGTHCFYRCQNLRKVDLSKCQLIKIDSSTFCDCELLETVLLPPSLNSIENAAFSNCKYLKSIEIPSSVVYIKEFSFRNCASLSKIVIPASVSSLGSNCFGECRSLNEIESISNSLSLVKNNAFSYCNENIQVKLPSSVKYDYNSFPHQAKIINT